MTAQRQKETTFASLRARGGRENWLLHDFNSDGMQRGLEIGALDNPTALPDVVCIEYVDYAPTEVLQGHPHEDSVKRNRIVDVDHVWPGTGPLDEVCGRKDYDFVIASHVIEHVPNVLGWFEGIFSVLRPNGVFNLAIPDRRFTFDVKRKESTLGEMVEAYLNRFERPSIRQMFDHTHDAAAVAPGAPWDDAFSLSTIPRYSGEGAIHLAYAQAKELSANKRYYDSHCWVFTPFSFLDCIEGAIKLGLFPFVFSDITSTARGSFEFFISLRKETERTGTYLQEWQLATISHLKKKLAAQP